MKTQLQTLLADSYILMLKTQNFHWNVKGPLFTSLHTLFETQYNDLFLAVDEIAERLKAIGEYAPGNYNDYQKLSSIKDSKELNAKNMIEEMVQSTKLLITTAKKLQLEADKLDDNVTADLAIRRIEIHEKNIWMLKSHLED